MGHSSLLVVAGVVILECIILLWYHVRAGRSHLRVGDFLIDFAGGAFALFMAITITRAQLLASAASNPEDFLAPARLAYEGPLNERDSMAAPDLPPSATVVLTATSTQTPLPTATLPPIIHIVQRGEALSFIAARYGVAEDAILLANQLTSDTLVLDQRLVIPPPGASGWMPTAEAVTAVDPTPAPASPTIDNRSTVHTVQEGETLGQIALLYDTSVETIIKANGELDGDRLAIGQNLVIPAATGTAVPVAIAPQGTRLAPTSTAAATFTPLASETPTRIPTRTVTAALASETPTRSPTRTATLTPLPTNTATAVPPSPTATATETAVPSPLPSATPTPVPSATPSLTSVPATATVVVQENNLAPRLLSPRNEQTFEGQNATVNLRWEWEAPLLPEQSFEIQLWTDGQEPVARAWVRSSAWDVPPAYFGHSWNWRVVVVQGERGASQVISAPSADGRFHWR